MNKIPKLWKKCSASLRVSLNAVPQARGTALERSLRDLPILKKTGKFVVAALLGCSLLLQGFSAGLQPEKGVAWAAELTDSWVPGGAEAREAICIEDGGEMPVNMLAAPRLMARSGQSIWNLGGDYAYTDLGTRSNGAARQALYQNIAQASSSFSTNTADVADYRGYYVISILPLLDSGLNLTANEVVETYFMFRSDNPQYYWLSNQVIYSSKDGYVNRLYLAVYSDFISGELRSAIASDLETKLQGYIGVAEAAGTDRAAQIAAVYEKLSEEIRYNADNDDGWVHTIAGAFGTRSHTNAVCEGFSKMLQVVMNAMNIPNLFVAGNLTSTGVGHAWNLVQMEDGQYYGLDATWDNGAGRGNWTYFLSGTDSFAANHTPLDPTGTGARFQYDLPAMSATVYPGAAAQNIPPGVIPPGETDPAESDPVETDPAETDPAETDPAAEEPVTPGELAINSLEISGLDENGYTVTAEFSAPAGVKEVLMPTWTEANGQDDLIWHRASVSGNTAVFTVKTAEHKKESGNYITHVYVRDMAGGEVLKGVAAVVPAGNSPQDYAGQYLAITSISIENASAQGYLVKATFTSPAEVKEVLMPSWTAAGGQDDLIWHKASVSGNTASFFVKSSDHKSEGGKYITHVYVKDVNGNQVLDGREVNVPGSSQAQAAPAIASVWTSDVTADGYTVHAAFTGTASKVLMPSWTAANGQDDLIWHKAEVSGDTATFRVKAAEHKGENGSYITHVYVYGENGSYVIAGVNAALPAAGTGSGASLPHNGLDYGPIFDADYYLNRYPDLRAAFGTDAQAAFNHFLTFGMKEGRIASPNFNVHTYRGRYGDLQAAFGGNLTNYYIHYLQYGIAEKRQGI